MLRNNKQQIETNAIIQSNAKDLQINITDSTDSILIAIQKNGVLLSQSVDELKKDQMVRLDTLSQSLNESFSLLKIEISRLNDTMISEQKSMREDSNRDIKSVIAEIQKLQDDIAKFRHFLDQAITV